MGQVVSLGNLRQAETENFASFGAPQKLKFTSARTGQFSPRGTGLSQQGPVSRCEPEKPTFGNRSLPRGTGLSPAGTGLGCQGPVASPAEQHCSLGTGLSHQGPVPESKNSQDSAKTLEIELLGRISIYGLPPSVEKFEYTSNTRTSQFAKVQCATS
uniref:Uncharacterized protein n=1 Tax=Ananas comosus var. bracteatus TaxID=296719 RepID=A0A6V7QBY5_ANACO|nr:unnamed protein product [Ananas comosus var. bracteatus]